MAEGDTIPLPIPDIKLVSADDPILRQPALPCSIVMKEIDDQVIPFIYPMKEIMRRLGGVGLAAPQVGINLRFFLMVDEGNKVHIAINPVIHQKFGLRRMGPEGCLSFPGRGDVDVPRWERILLEWRRTDGQKRVQWFKGRDARIIQHETDHLNGICIFT